MTKPEPQWLAEIRERKFDDAIKNVFPDRQALLAYIDKLREALNEIAAWHDTPKPDGSMGHFDCPRDARLARQALAFKPEGVE